VFVVKQEDPPYPKACQKAAKEGQEEGEEEEKGIGDKGGGKAV
jgi:hypothetical protein